MLPMIAAVHRQRPQPGAGAAAAALWQTKDVVAPVHIYGTHKSLKTKQALRFFKERGVPVQFVDLQRRALARGEIARFVQKFGLAALVDTAGKAYQRAGLGYLRLSDEALLQRLLGDPQLLVQPLLRLGNALYLGWDEAVWREWYARHKRGVG